MHSFIRPCPPCIPSQACVCSGDHLGRPGCSGWHRDIPPQRQCRDRGQGVRRPGSPRASQEPKEPFPLCTLPSTALLIEHWPPSTAPPLSQDQTPSSARPLLKAAAPCFFPSIFSLPRHWIEFHRVTLPRSSARTGAAKAQTGRRTGARHWGVHWDSPDRPALRRSAASGPSHRAARFLMFGGHKK